MSWFDVAKDLGQSAYTMAKQEITEALKDDEQGSPEVETQFASKLFKQAQDLTANGGQNLTTKINNGQVNPLTSNGLRNSPNRNPNLTTGGSSGSSATPFTKGINAASMHAGAIGQNLVQSLDLQNLGTNVQTLGTNLGTNIGELGTNIGANLGPAVANIGANIQDVVKDLSPREETLEDLNRKLAQALTGSEETIQRPPGILLSPSPSAAIQGISPSSIQQPPPMPPIPGTSASTNPMQPNGISPTNTLQHPSGMTNYLMQPSGISPTKGVQPPGMGVQQPMGMQTSGIHPQNAQNSTTQMGGSKMGVADAPPPPPVQVSSAGGSTPSAVGGSVSKTSTTGTTPRKDPLSMLKGSTPRNKTNSQGNVSPASGHRGNQLQSQQGNTTQSQSPTRDFGPQMGMMSSDGTPTQRKQTITADMSSLAALNATALADGSSLGDLGRTSPKPPPVPPLNLPQQSNLPQELETTKSPSQQTAATGGMSLGPSIITLGVPAVQSTTSLPIIEAPPPMPPMPAMDEKITTNNAHGSHNSSQGMPHGEPPGTNPLIGIHKTGGVRNNDDRQQEQTSFGISGFTDMASNIASGLNASAFTTNLIENVQKQTAEISQGMVQQFKEIQMHSAMEEALATIKMSDHNGIVSLDIQLYIEMLMSMSIPPEHLKTVLMEMLTAVPVDQRDERRQAIQYLLIYITKLIRRMKKLQDQWKVQSVEFQRMQAALEDMEKALHLQQEEGRQRELDMAQKLKEEMKDADAITPRERDIMKDNNEKMRAEIDRLEALVAEKDKNHQESVSTLQQAFEDLQEEHERTHERTRALLRHKQGGPGSMMTLGGPNNMGGTLSPREYGRDGIGSSSNLINPYRRKYSDPAVNNIDDRSDQLVMIEMNELIKENLDLKRQLGGHTRDIERLIREKEAWFFERESYVDRRMVLTMASQLQTEPNPALKDQILQQMIDILCVDDTWKKLIPQRPVAQKKKPSMADALIDFVDQEIEKSPQALKQQRGPNPYDLEAVQAQSRSSAAELQFPPEDDELESNRFDQQRAPVVSPHRYINDLNAHSSLNELDAKEQNGSPSRLANAIAGNTEVTPNAPPSSVTHPSPPVGLPNSPFLSPVLQLADENDSMIPTLQSVEGKDDAVGLT